MSYEVSSSGCEPVKGSLAGTLKEAKTRIEYYEASAEEGWSSNVETIKIALDTHVSTMINKRPDPDQEHPFLCEYEMRTTPEWQRIQDRLKRADELEAELDRERKSLYKGRWEKSTEELTTLKERLPKNADGDVVLWGDEQWIKRKAGPSKLYFNNIKGCNYVTGGVEDELTLHGWEEIEQWTMRGYSKDFYSTKESCRKSMEGSE